jgi:hypothetical protein
MRYSDVLKFYGILAEGSLADSIDIHFSNACIHWQLREISVLREHYEMHDLRLSGYMIALKELVRNYACFSVDIIDQSGKGLHLRENWVGDHLVDDQMFNSMPKNFFNPGTELAADCIYLSPVYHCSKHLIKLVN